MFDSTAESIHKSSETRKVYSYQDKHVYYRDLVRWTGQVDLQLGLQWSWYSFQIETRFDWDQIFGRQVKGEGEKRFGCEALGARPGGTFFFHWGPDYTKVELSCLTAWPSDIFLTWPSYICLGQVIFDLAKQYFTWKQIFDPVKKNGPSQTLNDLVKVYLTWPRKYLTWLVRVMQAIMWFLVWGSFAIRRITLLLLTKWWMNKPMVSRVQTGKVCLAILSFKMIVS